jgi:hypothetical protein
VADGSDPFWHWVMGTYDGGFYILENLGDSSEESHSLFPTYRSNDVVCSAVYRAFIKVVNLLENMNT